MLYYVKTGVISVRTESSSHKQAALQTILSNDLSDLGICTIVSEKKIKESNIHDQVCFLTESFLEESNSMRLVS